MSDLVSVKARRKAKKRMLLMRRGEIRIPFRTIWIWITRCVYCLELQRRYFDGREDKPIMHHVMEREQSRFADQAGIGARKYPGSCIIISVIDRNSYST